MLLPPVRAALHDELPVAVLARLRPGLVHGQPERAAPSREQPACVGLLRLEHALVRVRDRAHLQLGEARLDQRVQLGARGDAIGSTLSLRTRRTVATGEAGLTALALLPCRAALPVFPVSTVLPVRAILAR